MNQFHEPTESGGGLRRVRNATHHSFDGIGAAWRHEAAFRQEAVAAAVLIPLALLLDVPAIGKALMIGSVIVVLVVELLNSAIEATIDRISLDRHRLAKRAKDLGSAAVMLCLANVALIWGLVLFG